MDFSEKLTVGILITIIAWLITGVVMFLLKRYRLSCAIVSDISYHILGVREGRNYLEKLFQRTILENKAIEYAAYYSKDEYELYKCIQQDIVKLFDKRKLLKIIKFYKTFWELEVLFEGLMLDLMKWKEEKRLLSKDDVEYLRRKQTRILKLCDILARKEILKLDDLPDDYQGKIEPSTIIL